MSVRLIDMPRVHSDYGVLLFFLLKLSINFCTFLIESFCCAKNTQDHGALAGMKIQLKKFIIQLPFFPQHFTIAFTLCSVIYFSEIRRTRRKKDECMRCENDDEKIEFPSRFISSECFRIIWMEFLCFHILPTPSFIRHRLHFHFKSIGFLLLIMGVFLHFWNLMKYGFLHGI